MSAVERLAVAPNPPPPPVDSMTAARPLVASLALALASLAPSAALAQAAAPKHCVAVARDPDDAVRALAVRFERVIASHPGARGVADERARGALRGEPALDATADPNLVAARRALAFSEGDLEPLSTISDQLGCASITVLTATPRGLAVRRFEALSRSFDAITESAEWTEPAIVQRLGLATDPVLSTPPAARPTGPSAVTAVPASAPTARPATSDPRVSVADPARASGNDRRAPVWAFVLAGVAGAALVGGFLIAQSVGPSMPLVRVSGPGVSP
jgi:hypothetical protein